MAVMLSLRRLQHRASIHDHRHRSSRRAAAAVRDPLDGIFEKEVVPLLVECPALRAVTIFEELRRRHRKLPASVRRTIERRVRRWRALHGPEQEVIFAQKNPPGRLGLSDFTATGDLGVTIGGVPLTHLLYHFRLPTATSSAPSNMP